MAAVTCLSDFVTNATETSTNTAGDKLVAYLRREHWLNIGEKKNRNESWMKMYKGETAFTNNLIIIQ